jgi:ankyrin repeat protein
LSSISYTISPLMSLHCDNINSNDNTQSNNHQHPTAAPVNGSSLSSPEYLQAALDHQDVNQIKAYFNYNHQIDLINQEILPSNFTRIVQFRIPLHYSIRWNKIRSVRCLVEDLSCNINQTEPDNNRSAVLLAANYGHYELLEYLINHNADPTISTQTNWNALIDAANKNRINFMQLLLKNDKININQQSYGETALILAVHNNNVQAVELLLQHNAKVDIVNARKQTALDIAKQKDNAQLVTLLEAAMKKSNNIPDERKQICDTNLSNESDNTYHQQSQP